jgi:hypothetical protein
MRTAITLGLLVCTMLLLAPPTPVSLSAQQYVYVPDSNTSTGSTNVYPFGTGNEWRYQIVVPASGLPTKPFKILEVAIVARRTTTFTASQCQIRMCHTTINDFQSNRNYNQNLVPCPTEVFNGPIKFAGTTNQFADLGIRHSHGHDGTRNLLIEVRFQGGSGNMSLGMTTSVLAVRRMWNSGSGAYGATTGSVDPLTVSGAPKLRLNIDQTTGVLLCSDTANIGTKTTIQLRQAPPGDFYQMAAALSRTPLPVGKCTINLTLDNVFLFSVQTGVPIFNSYAGSISPQGNAFGTFAIPKLPALVGICVYHAAVAYNKNGISGCTNTCGLQIR